MLVDTHCHIQSIAVNVGEEHTRELWQKSKLTPEEVITNAQAAGVYQLICVGCDLIDSQLAVDFVKDRPPCFASVGIHPHEAQHFADDRSKLLEFKKLVKQPKVVAIGECGLDYYYLHSNKADQLKILRFQIELALEHCRPLIFHVRQAFDQFWPVLDSYPPLKGVVHSFTDNQSNLEQALKRGLYVGVNGIATFAKDETLLALYKRLPLESLLLETDAPFLTPTPYRGSINEPKRLRVIAEFLADLRGEDQVMLENVTSQNAQALFGL